MKEGWKYVKFKDVLPIKMGKTPPRADLRYWDIKKITQNKWVSISDISQNEDGILKDTKEYISDIAIKNIYKVPKGSLLMSFKLSIGRMAFAGDELYTNEAIIAIPENNTFNLRFLFYYLKSYNWLVHTEGNEKVKGATLNKKTIGEILLPIIPLSEQEAIVERLDSSFAKIDAVKAKAEKCLDEAKALFQSALTEMMKPKEGWEEKKLGEVGTFKRGGNFSKNDFQKSGFPCIHYGQIHTKFGIRTVENLTFVSDEIVKKDRCAKHGDLVIAITSEDNEGSCKCTAWMGNYDVYVGAHAAIFSHSCHPIFMSYYFLSPSFQKEKLNYTHGFKVVEINPKDISKITIPLPPLSEQESIVSRLDAMSEKVKALEANYKKTVAECDALKQAILRDIFEQ